MEEYANAGLIFLQDKYDNEKYEFQDPFVFVNFLKMNYQGRKLSGFSKNFA